MRTKAVDLSPTSAVSRRSFLRAGALSAFSLPGLLKTSLHAAESHLTRKQFDEQMLVFERDLKNLSADQIFNKIVEELNRNMAGKAEFKLNDLIQQNVKRDTLLDSIGLKFNSLTSEQIDALTLGIWRIDLDEGGSPVNTTNDRNKGGIFKNGTRHNLVVNTHYSVRGFGPNSCAKVIYECNKNVIPFFESAKTEEARRLAILAKLLARCLADHYGIDSPSDMMSVAKKRMLIDYYFRSIGFHVIPKYDGTKLSIDLNISNQGKEFLEKAGLGTKHINFFSDRLTNIEYQHAAWKGSLR